MAPKNAENCEAVYQDADLESRFVTLTCIVWSVLVHGHAISRFAQ